MPEIILAIFVCGFLFSIYGLIRNHYAYKIKIEGNYIWYSLSIADLKAGRYDYMRWQELYDARSYHNIMWGFYWTTKSAYPELVAEFESRGIVMEADNG